MLLGLREFAVQEAPEEMITEILQLPAELVGIECELPRNGARRDSQLRGCLDSGNELNRLLDHFMRCRRIVGVLFEPLRKAAVAQIFLKNDSVRSLDIDHLWNWKICLREETSHVEERVVFRIEGSRIEADDQTLSRTALRINPEVGTCRSVRCQRLDMNHAWGYSKVAPGVAAHSSFAQVNRPCGSFVGNLNIHTAAGSRWGTGLSANKTGNASTLDISLWPRWVPSWA